MFTLVITILLFVKIMFLFTPNIVSGYIHLLTARINQMELSKTPLILSND